MDIVYSVGIIGGGISGAVTALELAKYGIDTILFEQKNSVVNGPPFCHLHAGGNLYPDISDEQCKILMKQSIEMARLFPQSIDQRPTFISIPESEKYEPEKIKNRLELLVRYYKELINSNPENKILGSPEDYFKSYSKEDLISLEKETTVKSPNSLDEWMLNTLKLIDYKKLKTPVFIVQEYGWNLFRLAAQAQLALNKTEKCNLNTNTTVTDIKDIRSQNSDYNWEVCTPNETYKVKYLVNSSGFNTGTFDESLELKTRRLIEFKAAYVSKWNPISGLIPELIFHGERGTPNGMVQLTPYSNNYYQIHGMTMDITLFKDGLVKSKNYEAQPEFSNDIKQKLNEGWKADEVKDRTERAINFVSKFVPSFKSASVGGPPLFGAQQIPGNDLSLRVGEVSFPSKAYARSEIVKASSALTVAKQILNQIQEENIVPTIQSEFDYNPILDSISKNEIDMLSGKIATQRGYPKDMSRLVIEH